MKGVSVVIPVYNEEEALPHLAERIFPVMEEFSREGRAWEILFVNDGSRDGSFALLHRLCDESPGRVKLVDLNGNFGQHMAIIAGFDSASQDYVITIDADMQTPPEEIPKLVAAMDEGHDVVGTYRENRRDPLFRKLASKMVNRATNRISGLRLRDYGCMLRGYSRGVVRIIVDSDETMTFIPALAQKFAANPAEIPVKHNEREYGSSKYGLFKLIRLNFDLMTSFSLVPLQIVTMTGIALSIASVLFFAFLMARRFIVGSEAEGVFTLMAIQFCLTGITMLSVGISGEYIGRIYAEVRKRPRFIIRRIFDGSEEQTPEERGLYEKLYGKTRKGRCPPKPSH